MKVNMVIFSGGTKTEETDLREELGGIHGLV